MITAAKYSSVEVNSSPWWTSAASDGGFWEYNKVFIDDGGEERGKHSTILIDLGDWFDSRPNNGGPPAERKVVWHHFVGGAEFGHTTVATSCEQFIYTRAQITCWGVSSKVWMSQKNTCPNWNKYREYNQSVFHYLLVYLNNGWRLDSRYWSIEIT